MGDPDRMVLVDCMFSVIHGIRRTGVGVEGPLPGHTMAYTTDLQIDGARCLFIFVVGAG